MYWDIPSLILVACLPFGVLFWAKPQSKNFSFRNLIFLRKTTREQSEENVVIIRSMISGCYLGGIIGTVMGLVVIMANLSDPDKIGPGLAVAIITLVYSYLFAGILEGYRAYFQSDLT